MKIVMHAPYFLYFLFLSFFTISAASKSTEQLSSNILRKGSLLGDFVADNKFKVGRNETITMDDVHDIHRIINTANTKQIPHSASQNQENNLGAPVTKGDEQEEQSVTENLTTKIKAQTEKAASFFTDNIDSYINQEQLISYIKQYYPYIISGTVFTIVALCTVIKWSTASLSSLKKKRRKKKHLTSQASAEIGEATNDDLSENDSLI